MTIRQQIERLRSRISERKARRESAASLEARLVLLTLKLIKEEMRDEKRRAA